MDHVATLRVVVPARLDLARVTAVLGQPEIPWLGERLPDTEGSMRRYLSDLEFHLGDLGPIAFRKSAVVSLGSGTRDGSGWSIPVEWQAATLAPLFPVFVGTLRFWADRAVLDGRYAPPGGRLGQAADALLLGVAAGGTARWFIGRITDRLAADAASRSGFASASGRHVAARRGRRGTGLG